MATVVARLAQLSSAHGQLIKTERGASQRGERKRREGVEQTATGREAAVQFELE